MSDFDPYYKWLGIPPEEQPPNHYRLLGLQVLEQNLEVIASAANRQMAYLQELSSGDDHIDEAQRLLGEVARARVCLLAAESKARYDAELTSTLDSLPEAEEATPESSAVPEFDSADRGAAAPRRSATRRSGGKKRTSTARRSGRRSPPTKNTSRGAAREEEEVATPTGASSLQVKLAAAVIPGVIVVVIGIGIVWMVAGGDSSSKQGTKNDREKKTGSEASPGQGDNKDPLEAARNKNFGNQAGDNGSNRPPKPVVKRPKADSQPVNSKLDKPSEQPAAAPTENTADEPSEAELAEKLLEEKGLEEGLNSTWELVDLTADYDEAKKATGSQAASGSGADFETELIRQTRHYWEALNAFYKRTNYHQHPANDPTAREAAAYLNSVGQRGAPGRPDLLVITFENGATLPYPVPEDIAPLSLRDKVQREISTQPTSPPKSNKVIVEISKLLHAQYATLQADAEVQAALATVEGKLAEPPDVPNTSAAGANSIASNSSPAASSTSSASAGSDSPPQSEPPPKEPEPTLGFAELKEKLTALDKETKLSLGKFNKKAKAYSKKKKELTKLIKARSALLAQKTQILDSMPDSDRKTAFGTALEKELINPLKKFEKELAALPKPTAWPETKAVEGNLSQAEKWLKQIEGTAEYQEKPGPIDSLASRIAKYGKGFEVQTSRLAN